MGGGGGWEAKRPTLLFVPSPEADSRGERPGAVPPLGLKLLHLYTIWA